MPGKNFEKINDKPLYQIIIDKAVACDDIDYVYTDTDSLEIKRYAKDLGVPNKLGNVEIPIQSRNGNTLLYYDYYNCVHFEKDDLVFQLFATAPFLKKETISDCINILKTCNQYDSVFTATEEVGWFWDKDLNPINYDPSVLPRSQDADHVIQETTGLYGIRSSKLLESKCRIGDNPFVYYVDHIEGIDIDYPEDLEYARHIAETYNWNNE